MNQLITFLALLTLAMTAGCTKKQSGSYNLDRSETLIINLSAEPPSLDWHKATDTTSSEVTSNTMEGLVTFDFNDPELKLIPGLAESWSSSKDQKIWTFKLRKDVVWTDGVPFTAQHVIDGWERLLNKNTGAQYAYFLFSIKNAQKYNQGQIEDFSQVGVKINESGDLVVELEQPKSYFPMLLDHTSTYPVRKDVVEKFGNLWTRPENIQTLGPYKMTVWDNDKAIVLVRNDKYFGPPAKTKNILMRIIKESSTALKMYEKGELDALYELPSLEMRRLKQLPQYKNQLILGTYYLGFHTKKAPMDNLKVRKAINMAIDRSEITRLLDGGQIPVTGWIPKGMFGYDDKIGLGFNVEQAQKLMDEAGYKDRKKFPRIIFGFNTNENHQRLAENVQAQLKRNLGIDIELQNSEWKSYMGILQADAPHIWRMGWIGDYPDPDNFFGLITSFSENNHTRWGNSKYDELIKKATTIPNGPERKKVYDEAHRLLTEVDVPVVPIYQYTSSVLVADRVKNFPLNALSKKQYKFTTIE